MEVRSSEGLGGIADLQLNGACGEVSVWRDEQLADGDGQLEATRARATWIDVQNALTFDDHRLVRVTGNDYTNTGGSRLDSELRKVMDDVDAHTSGNEQFALTYLLSPCASVVVSADRCDWRQCGELFKDAWTTNVTGMNDVAAADEERLGFRPKETVGIGYQAHS